MFVTFEGPEGSGKSTQIGLLREALERRGHDVVATREPGGTPIGEAIRNLLVEGDLVPTPLTEALLMTAARAEHVRRIIRPALDDGGWVLCDRYVDSTIAYQGAGRGLDVDDLIQMQKFATDGLIPDVTILLDLDVTEGLRRRRSGGDENRFDRETVDFHMRVADWFRRTARCEPERWLVVDGGLPISVVAQEIESGVVERLDASVLAR